MTGKFPRPPIEARSAEGGSSVQSGLVRSCISRAPDGTFHRLLKAVGQGDAAAKGQLRADPWQLANDIVLGLAFAGRKAA